MVAGTIIEAIKDTMDLIWIKASEYPLFDLVLSYIKRSYQNDPARVVIEVLLLFFALKYLTMMKGSSAAGREKSGEVKITEKEIDELVDDWEPEPLESSNIGAKNVKKVQERAELELEEAKDNPVLTSSIDLTVRLEDGREVTNWSSNNFLGIYNHPRIKNAAIEAVKYYGVGTCGPSGFYGTLDVHLELEAELARILQVEAAIIYSQSFAATSSIIPSFSKRGDIVVVDEGVNVAILKGLQISRSKIYWFKHNDMEDLERILDQIKAEDAKTNRTLTRRFIVVEGLYAKYGDIVPLKSIVNLKHRYKYRLIIDESLSIGAIGPRALGVADYFGIARSELDIIIGSFSGALGSGGGFSAGSEAVVDHQKLSSQAYCFSASLPGLLAKGALEAIKMFDEGQPEGRDIVSGLHGNIELFNQLFASSIPGHFSLIGDPASPLRFLRASSRIPGEDRLVGLVVEKALNHGVLLCMARFVEKEEEKECPPPSIKICISSGFTEAKVGQFASLLRLSIEEAKREFFINS